MNIEVRVPVLPESIADATLVCWHKACGETIQRDEKLVDLETDKVVLEVPAPVDGIILEITRNVDDVVKSGDVLAVIGTQDGQTSLPESTVVESSHNTEGLVDLALPEDPALSPSVRRLVKQHQLDPKTISGSGKGGRITKEDVFNHLALNQPANAAPAIATPYRDGFPAATPEPLLQSHRPATMANGEHQPSAERREQRVPMTRLRARVAERLMIAQQTAAILTTFNEANLQAIIDLRERHREQFAKQHGTKLGLMSFFLKASIDALKQYPIINAAVDGQDIIYHHYYDIGIAVASLRGLVVPVLRDADQLSFAAMESAIATFSAKAKAGTLTYDDLAGGTFTISNGGVFGSMLSTPILNPPQSAILGMHAINQRPVVEDGNIVARPMMYLALSYDHRIIDGREAALFLVRVKQNLEDPGQLLLGM